MLINSSFSEVRCWCQSLLKGWLNKVNHKSCFLLSFLSWQNECVMNIMRDLAYYHTAIETYLKSPLHRPETEIPLLSPTLGILRDLRKVSESCWTRGDATNMWCWRNRWGNLENGSCMIKSFSWFAQNCSPMETAEHNSTEVIFLIFFLDFLCLFPICTTVYFWFCFSSNPYREISVFL